MTAHRRDWDDDESNRIAPVKAIGGPLFNDDDAVRSYSDEIKSEMYEVTGVQQKPRFDGSTYDAEKDEARLSEQLRRVRACMIQRANNWVSPEVITFCAGSGVNWASAGARVRDLRKVQFGGHIIKRRRTPGGNGSFQYMLVKE